MQLFVQRLQNGVGRLFVARERLGELPAALRHGAERGRIGQEFALRRFGGDDLRAVLLRVHADDAPAALVQISHDVADVLFGYGDFQVREGFQKDGIGVLHALLEGDLRRRLERRFGGVHVVIASVV